VHFRELQIGSGFRAGHSSSDDYSMPRSASPLATALEPRCSNALINWSVPRFVSPHRTSLARRWTADVAPLASPGRPDDWDCRALGRA
jgi:hypothetical protein